MGTGSTGSNSLSRDHSRLSLFSALSGTSNVSQDEQYRSERHAENSLSSMRNYLQAGKLCDIVLVAGVGGIKIQAHR